MHVVIELARCPGHAEVIAPGAEDHGGSLGLLALRVRHRGCVRLERFWGGWDGLGGWDGFGI